MAEIPLRHRLQPYRARAIKAMKDKLCGYVDRNSNSTCGLPAAHQEPHDFDGDIGSDQLPSNDRFALMAKLRSGGDYLGVARSFLQRRAIGGDRITWGTSDLVTGLTARDIEDMALEIAAAAILQDRAERLRPTGQKEKPESVDWVCPRCQYGNIAAATRVCDNCGAPRTGAPVLSEETGL
jgi:hypothetical protein